MENRVDKSLGFCEAGTDKHECFVKNISGIRKMQSAYCPWRRGERVGIGSSPQPVENAVYNSENPRRATDFPMTNLFHNDKRDDKCVHSQEVRSDQT